MRITKCDNHHDRDAVITLIVRVLPVGVRPFLLGLEIPKKYRDLCEECRDNIIGIEDIEKN